MAMAAVQRGTAGVGEQENTALRASSPTSTWLHIEEDNRAGTPLRQPVGAAATTTGAVQSVRWLEMPPPISTAVEAADDAMDGEVR